MTLTYLLVNVCTHAVVSTELKYITGLTKMGMGLTYLLVDLDGQFVIETIDLQRKKEKKRDQRYTHISREDENRTKTGYLIGKKEVGQK